MPYFYRDPNAPMPNKPTSVGVVALIEHEGALLLDCRADGGQWGLIGGAVANDESLAEALCREVAEETGLTVRSYALFGTFSDPSRIIQYPDGNTMRIITLAYRVEVEHFDVLRCSGESTALRFVSPHELRHLDIAATHRHIVDHYLSSPRPPLIVLE